jgi:hypothetical protein
MSDQLVAEMWKIALPYFIHLEPKGDHINVSRHTSLCVYDFFNHTCSSDYIASHGKMFNEYTGNSVEGIGLGFV